VTANAFALNIKTQQIVDPLNGFQDLKQSLINVVDESQLKNNPISFLKILWFAAESSFKFSASAKNTLLRQNHYIKAILNEDIGTLLRQVLRGVNPKHFFDLADQFGVLEHIMPRLAEASKIAQTKKNGVANVRDHVLLSLQAANPHNEAVCWAALYHDLGKITTRKVINKKVRFFGHEKVSAQWAYKDLIDWGFNRDFAKEVAHLTLYHMFDGGPQLSDDGVRRLIRRVGKQHIFNLLELREADSAGFIGKPTGLWKVQKLKRRVVEELNKNPFSHVGLDISLEQVAKEINAEHDKEAELVLDFLLDMVLFHQLPNQEKDLINWLQNINFGKVKNFCPLGLQWLLEQQISKLEGRPEDNTDGTLKCGKYCQFKCDNQEQNLWKY